MEAQRHLASTGCLTQFSISVHRQFVGLASYATVFFFARKKNYSPIALRRPKRIFAAALQKSNKKPD